MVFAYPAGGGPRLAGPVAAAHRPVSPVAQAARRTLRTGGSCPGGCWLERGSDGREYCYCPDAQVAMMRGAGLGGPTAGQLMLILGGAAVLLFLTARRR